MRQLGGSFGIAIITTMLHERLSFHRNNLIEHINTYSPEFTERISGLTNTFIARGYALQDAQTLAYKALEGTIVKQTYLLSYMDGFWFIGIFFIFCIPLLYLQKFNRTAKVDAGGH
jgi:MFS transporter, DHA2 family, multidrug resistance protein